MKLLKSLKRLEGGQIKPSRSVVSYRAVINGPARLSGYLRVPGDKSISHRALIFSAIASGRTRISNILTSADCLSTASCLRRLGVEIELKTDHAIVQGRELYGLIEPDDVLDVGNSGTALRILPAVLAAQPFFSVITGDSSIRGRPVDRVIKPLAKMGGRLWARGGGNLAPVAIDGCGLRGIEYRLPVASAQVKTAVLLAGLLAEGKTTVIEPVLARDHTEIMARFLGTRIDVEMDSETTGRRITVTGQKQFVARDISVPGDFSSAAFFLAAAVLAGEGAVKLIEIGLNPTRIGFIEILRQMGAGIGISDETNVAGEAVGSITTNQSSLDAVAIGGGIIPRAIDEIPLVVLAATQAHGRTTITDAAELRVKETDRINLVANELNKMGAKISGTPDGFVVEGSAQLTGAVVDSHGDHRLSMMLAVAALAAKGETTIKGAEAVSVSFPDFFDGLRKLGAEIRIVEDERAV